MSSTKEKEEKEKIITKGKTFSFIRIYKNKYRINSEIQNTNIYMKNILNFNLLKLMCELNKDNYDMVNFNDISNNEAILYILFKNNFKDFGILHRYCCFRVKLEINNNGITFNLTPETEYGQQINKVKTATMVPIKKMTISGRLINNHKIEIIEEMEFESSHDMMPIVENFLGMVLKASFKKLKYFIEAIK